MTHRRRRAKPSDLTLLEWAVILVIAGPVGAWAGLPPALSVIGMAFLVIVIRRGEV